jgi:hypothetical protein
MIDAVDAECEARLDRPLRATMLRELVAEALAARKSGKALDPQSQLFSNFAPALRAHTPTHRLVHALH